jgi:hypothetical protein
MRRLLAITVGLGLIGASAYADVIDFTPFAGYTTVAMTDVNKGNAEFTGLEKYESAMTPGVTMDNTDLSNAWIAGGDLLTTKLSPWQNLSLGIRGEYLATNTSNNQLNDAALGGTAWKVQDNGTLTSLMLGGRYQLPGAQYGLSLSVGVFGGFGYATMWQALTVPLIPGGMDNRSGLYQGEGFVGDLDLRLDWVIPHVKWLHLDAQGGYRYASLGDLSDHGKPLTSGYDQFLQLLAPGTTGSGSAEDVDFSGLTGEGGLSVNF